MPAAAAIEKQRKSQGRVFPLLFTEKTLALPLIWASKRKKFDHCATIYGAFEAKKERRKPAQVV
jgi:hypothetical protein